MKKTLILLFGLLLFSCTEPIRYRMYFVCSCEQGTKVQAFITENVAIVNNKFDKEMKDVIRELAITGARFNCEQKFFKVHYSNGVYILDADAVKLDSCEMIYTKYY